MVRGLDDRWSCAGVDRRAESSARSRQRRTRSATIPDAGTLPDRAAGLLTGQQPESGVPASVRRSRAVATHRQVGAEHHRVEEPMRRPTRSGMPTAGSRGRRADGATLDDRRRGVERTCGHPDWSRTSPVPPMRRRLRCRPGRCWPGARPMPSAYRSTHEYRRTAPLLWARRWTLVYFVIGYLDLVWRRWRSRRWPRTAATVAVVPRVRQGHDEDKQQAFEHVSILCPM